MLLHALRDGGEARFDLADLGRERLRQRQAHHGERPIGLDVEQALGEHAAGAIRHAMVEHQELGQPVAVLAEIGDHGRLAVGHHALAEAGRIEIGDDVGDILAIGADLDANAGDKGARCREAGAEGIDGDFGAEFRRRRRVPEIGRKFRVALPAQRAAAPAHRVVAGVCGGCRNTLGKRERLQDRLVGDEVGLGEEGDLEDDAGDRDERIGARMDFAERARPDIGYGKRKATLRQILPPDCAPTASSSLGYYQMARRVRRGGLTHNDHAPAICVVSSRFSSVRCAELSATPAMASASPCRQAVPTRR